MIPTISLHHRSQGLLFFVHVSLFLLCPTFSLILSVATFRERISQVFFVIYAFYYGAYVGPLMDLAVHYKSFHIFLHSPLFTAWNDGLINHIGSEPWHKLFKYALSLFTPPSSSL